MIAKTFGGLSAPYYFRHFLFGMIFPVGMFLIGSNDGTPSIPTDKYLFFALSTLLYPYSRFVYESIIDFILGNNTFVVNAFFMLITKAVTIMLCWLLAIFIAPVGLAYLFYHHSKAGDREQQE
ncbi:hypothetical protein RY831_13920 [Noviherbaspirillum sp. CPCC 100848]|uniref:Uncharacterized protein n=1 Tax=Noviherbaspirillum album TaxID=3080276 RepID=A0ABU6J9C7_9BURK|nr:hypothetical protein [Noviherbaspirillum sp. CPCC 100848]MEC4720256.1 hypothetical protein [Noviherbaspirillum sp. CPCC 100848]